MRRHVASEAEVVDLGVVVYSQEAPCRAFDLFCRLLSLQPEATVCSM